MDYSDTDSVSTLGYSDDEDSSDEVQRLSESVHRKLYLRIFGANCSCSMISLTGISNSSKNAEEHY